MGEKILIVDDDERILRTFARNLKLAGYSTLTAAGGKEALQIYTSENPDIVLLDVRMPHMDGFAVLQAIREYNPQAEVILVTGHGDQDTANEARQAGASDFILKPVDRVTLDNALYQARERLAMR